MEPVLEWVRTNWGETGLLGTWAGILVRLLWKNSRAWCNEAQRWYRTKGSTKTFGLIKHRDEDDDVVMIWEVMGIRFNFHSTGKYVDLNQPEKEPSDTPAPGDSDSPNKPQ